MVFWGLTCDFWAEFEEKKQQQRQRQLNQSLRPSGYALAFGPSYSARVNACPSALNEV
jgi:hypothetical protein